MIFFFLKHEANEETYQSVCHYKLDPGPGSWRGDFNMAEASVFFWQQDSKAASVKYSVVTMIPVSDYYSPD